MNNALGYMSLFYAESIQTELGKQGLLTRLIRDSAGPCFNPVGILESRKQWVNVCCRDPQRELEDYMITDIDVVCWN